MRVATEVPDENVWSNIFGSGFLQYPWWLGAEYVAGDWDTPGVVDLEIEDPNFEEDSGHTVKHLVNMNRLEWAVNQCVKVGVIPNAWEDWDSADYADCILQMAVLGEVFYG